MPSAKTSRDVPSWLNSIVILAIALSIPPLIFYLVALVRFLVGLAGATESVSLSTYGQQGDFFGGHIAAVTSSITLLVVLVTTYRQQVHERHYRTREHLLSGLALITQYDTSMPGCEQALRLLDYYSALALQPEDKESLLLLNTVITKSIRAKLEELDENPKSEVYQNARAAKRRIGELLRDHHLERKKKIHD